MLSVLKERAAQRAASVATMASSSSSSSSAASSVVVAAVGRRSQWPIAHPAVNARHVAAGPSCSLSRQQRRWNSTSSSGSGGSASEPPKKSGWLGGLLKSAQNMFKTTPNELSGSAAATGGFGQDVKNAPKAVPRLNVNAEAVREKIMKGTAPAPNFPADTLVQPPTPPQKQRHWPGRARREHIIAEGDERGVSRAAEGHGHRAHTHHHRSRYGGAQQASSSSQQQQQQSGYPSFASTATTAGARRSQSEGPRTSAASAAEAARLSTPVAGGAAAANAGIPAAAPNGDGNEAWRHSFRGLLKQYGETPTDTAAASANANSADGAGRRGAAPRRTSRQLLELLDSFKDQNAAAREEAAAGAEGGAGAGAVGADGERPYRSRRAHPDRRGGRDGGSGSGSVLDMQQAAQRAAFRRDAVTTQDALPEGPDVAVRTLTDSDDSVRAPTRVPGAPTTIPSVSGMEIIPTPSERNVPVPILASPIRKLLFTPERRLLRQELLAEDNSGIALPQGYTSIEPSENMNMSVFAPFITSSRDPTLRQLAGDYMGNIMGSTSSLTPLLTHLQFMFTNFRPVDTRTGAGGLFSDVFADLPDQYTTATRKPATAILRRRDGGNPDDGVRTGGPAEGHRAVWGVDGMPHGDPVSNQVLIDLGKVMERWYTLTPEGFANAMFKSRKSPENPQPQDPQEPSLFVKFGGVVLRAQLDCCDPDIKGPRKVFDLKTRATLPIRLDCSNWKDYTSYGLFKLKGLYNSFEREWYDMARSAFLKFSLQCRIGHMNGVVVAYHNTQQVFGLEYIPLGDMDRITFGSTASGTRDGPKEDNDGAILAEKSFTRTMHILSDVLTKITDEHKTENAIKVTFHAARGTGLVIYVETLPKVEDLKYFVDALPLDGEPDTIWGKPNTATLDHFSDPYTAALRVDALSTEQIRAALVRFKKNPEGERVVIASRLESTLGLHDDTPEPPVDYYRRLAERGHLTKYHVGVTNVLNGEVVTQPYDLTATDKLETTFSFKKLAPSPSVLATDYRIASSRSRLLSEFDLELRTKAHAARAAGDEDNADVRAFLNRRRAAARSVLHDAAKDHHNLTAPISSVTERSANPTDAAAAKPIAVPSEAPKGDATY